MQYTPNVNDLADLVAEEQDITLLAYTALQVEARRPGTIPQELLASLSGKVSTNKLSTNCVSLFHRKPLTIVCQSVAPFTPAWLIRDGHLDKGGFHGWHAQDGVSEMSGLISEPSADGQNADKDALRTGESISLLTESSLAQPCSCTDFLTHPVLANGLIMDLSVPLPAVNNFVTCWNEMFCAP